MREGKLEEPAPSGDASTQRTEGSSSPTLGLAVRLLVGGALLGHDLIKRTMASTDSDLEEPVRPLPDQPVRPLPVQPLRPLSDELGRPLPGQPAVPTDRLDRSTGAPKSSPAFRHLLIGALFDTGQRIERRGESFARTVASTVSPVVRWTRRSRLTAPARRRFNALSARGEARMQRWLDRGVLEEQRSRELLNTTITKVTNDSLDRVVDSPQVQGLVVEFVEAQGQSLGERFLEELRAQAVSGDLAVARIARRVVRHPKPEVPPLPRAVPEPAEEGTVPPHMHGRGAGFVSRLLAFFIDVIIISFALRSIGWLLEDLRMVTGWVLYIPAISSSADYATPIYVTLGGGLLLSAAYFAFFWGVAGVTPGKGLMGLRVIRRDGGSLSFLRSLFRLFGYWVSTLLSGLGYLWIAIDNRREAWHDKIARTAVIYAWDAHPSMRSLGSIMRAAEDTTENLPPGS